MHVAIWWTKHYHVLAPYNALLFPMNNNYFTACDKLLVLDIREVY